MTDPPTNFDSPHGSALPEAPPGLTLQYMRTATTEDRRYASPGGQALHSGDVSEYSAAFAADDVDKQPRNGTGNLAIYAGSDKLARIFLAEAGLAALGVNLEKELLAAERLELWGDFPSGRQTIAKLLKATTGRMADTRLRST